jgi:hypothetical protein
MILFLSYKWCKLQDEALVSIVQQIIQYLLEQIIMFIICCVSEACEHCKPFQQLKLCSYISNRKSLDIFLKNKPKIMRILGERNVVCHRLHAL